MDFARALVVGLGVAGVEVARTLRSNGVAVVAIDDHPSPSMRETAASLGVELVETPSVAELAALVGASDVVFPSPGVPEGHAVFDLARNDGRRVLSEFDLARMLDDRPVVAITGTDGKTTVTTLVTEMLVASGVPAIACGNTETPLVRAIADPAIEVFVVEASSFRLASTELFEPRVAVWLNFAPDHLDAHESLVTYEAAKARIWKDLDEEHGLAVVNASDPVVMANVDPRVETISFGLEGSGGDATVRGGVLVLPDGTELLGVDELRRSFPHDVENALAASVAALAAGATVDGVRSVLRAFDGLAHRIRFVGEVDGVRWYDDSKATTPHAVLAAVAAFDSVVLVAGGRNKGLDLSVLGGTVPPVRAVVAIGEAADEVSAAFGDRCPVECVSTDMTDAVEAARWIARPGDAVVLSPGCTSFDWFGSYAERGDAFSNAVRSLMGEGSR